MAHAITEQYMSDKEHPGDVQTPKHTNTKPSRTRLVQCGKGQHTGKVETRSEKYSALPIEGRKEEDLSLDGFLENIRRMKAGQGKMQVAETVMHVTELENTGGTKALGTDEIDLSRTSEETDPDDVLPVSAKMAAARCRGNNARRTIMIDSGDEGDVQVERLGSPHQTTEQEWVKTSRIVEPPKVTPRCQRRVPARRRQEFEDETCSLLRKAEEETVRSRLELEEHLSGASSITASEASGGISGLQTNHGKRKMAQVRKLQMCLSKWGLEGLTDDQAQCYFDRGSAWMSNRFKPWMQVHKRFWGQRLWHRVERLKTVVVEIRHLPAASEQMAIHILAKAGLDSASGFVEVIHFSNRCTTGRRVLTSEFVFLARPTSVLQKLLEGASTVPGIDGDALIEVSVGTEQNGRPLTSEEEWRNNKATEFSTV
jgi:hypothetical protein